MSDHVIHMREGRTEIRAMPFESGGYTVRVYGYRDVLTAHVDRIEGIRGEAQQAIEWYLAYCREQGRSPYRFRWYRVLLGVALFFSGFIGTVAQSIALLNDRGGKVWFLVVSVISYFGGGAMVVIPSRPLFTSDNKMDKR